MPRIVSVHCAALPSLGNTPTLTFVRMQGVEALSHLFSYTVQLKTPDSAGMQMGPAANVDLKSLVGQECSLTIALEGKGTGAAAGVGAGSREISGIITKSRIVRAEGRNILYELTLRPWLWLATRTSDFKIFQAQNVVDILDTVLGEYGFPVEKRLAGDYPVCDYQVQYGESDFTFVQRLMQEWGIYWYFEHKDNKHSLIICDHIGAHSPFTSAAYQTLALYPSNSKIDEEHLYHFDAAEQLTSGAWVTGDFDFTKPTADLTAMSKYPRETSHAKGEVYEWPGDYTQPADGDALARIRMEEQRVNGARAHGSGNVRAVVPGCTFTLSNHPHDAANVEYLILSARLDIEDVAEESGVQEFKQHVEFDAQPVSEPFRPVRTVPKPHTHGPQTATVSGPSGQEIWTDKYGRVKVQFHWDRYGASDENSSCWVRVSQPWAGSNFGAMHLPRIGQEVLVDFLNGDPDLPMITGRVYNAINMPPWSLPDNASQSGVLTRSTKGGSEATANALRFEDKKGEEEVWLHAEKDQRIEVEHDESHWVGNDRSKTVDHDETVQIGRDRTENVVRNETITIGKNRVKSVGIHETDVIGVDWNIAVGAVKAEVVGASCTQEVGAYKQCAVAEYFDTSVGTDNTISVGANETISVGEDQSVSVGKNYTMSVGEEHVVTVGKSSGFTIEENMNLSAGKEMIFDAGEFFQITCGESSLVMDKKGNISLKGKDITIESSGEQSFKSDKNITLKGNKILEN